jgi:hypothetical protein
LAACLTARYDGQITTRASSRVRVRPEIGCCSGLIGTAISVAIAWFMAVALLVLPGCAIQTGVTVDASGATLRAEWDVESESSGFRRIGGYLYNESNYRATGVQLLVEALDGSDRVITRRVERVVGSVPPSNRTYFEIRELPVAAYYRLHVHSYRLTDSSGWPFGR